MLSDISALSYEYRYEYKKIKQQENLILSDNASLKVLLRHSREDSEAFKQQFLDIEETYINNDSGYITGTITLESLKNIQSGNTGDRSFILLNVVTSQEVETPALVS